MQDKKQESHQNEDGFIIEYFEKHENQGDNKKESHEQQVNEKQELTQNPKEQEENNLQIMKVECEKQSNSNISQDNDHHSKDAYVISEADIHNQDTQHNQINHQLTSNTDNQTSTQIIVEVQSSNEEVEEEEQKQSSSSSSSSNQQIEKVYQNEIVHINESSINDVTVLPILSGQIGENEFKDEQHKIDQKQEIEECEKHQEVQQEIVEDNNNSISNQNTQLIHANSLSEEINEESKIQNNEPKESEKQDTIDKNQNDNISSNTAQQEQTNTTHSCANNLEQDQEQLAAIESQSSDLQITHHKESENIIQIENNQTIENQQPPSILPQQITIEQNIHDNETENITSYAGEDNNRQSFEISSSVVILNQQTNKDDQSLQSTLITNSLQITSHHQNQSTSNQITELHSHNQALDQQNHILDQQNHILDQQNHTLDQQNHTLDQHNHTLNQQNHILDQQNNNILDQHNNILDQHDNNILDQQNNNSQQTKSEGNTINLKNKASRKLTEDTLEDNSSFQCQHGFAISDEISFIKPKTDTMISENQSVMIADGAMSQQQQQQSSSQFETILEVSTDQSSLEMSQQQQQQQQQRQKQDNKNFQSAVFERESKQSNELTQDRMCRTEISDASSSSERKNNNEQSEDPNSFDVRRTRYRYIKCWEDNRVQIVGIFQNMIDNMSNEAIGIGSSSSKSNYIIIKYFKDKVQQHMQFTTMQINFIRNKGGYSFESLNAILTELDQINATRISNSKLFAHFVETSVIKEILNPNAIKYESRLNRYKDLSNFSKKKIQKIGRGAAEEYQDYSMIFSDLAAKELKTTNKKRLIKDFQRKDLCLNEWIFLSKVYEHYDCLKNFGLETLKFIKELKELEIQRVEGIKLALKLYVNRYEELIAKMPSNVLGQIKLEVANKASIKHSSFLYIKQKSIKRSQDNQNFISNSSNKEMNDSNDSSSPSKTNRSNFSNNSLSNNNNININNESKEIIEMQNLSIQEEGYSPNNKRRSESPEEKRFGNGRSPHTSQMLDPHRIMREDQNKLNRSLITQIEDCDINNEVSPYFMLKNYLAFEEQYYLRKLYEINDDCEVSFDHLFRFIEQFQLKDVKTSKLVRKEYKAQYIKSSSVKKDVLIIVTFDYNLIVVESLASNFFKKPICFIKGYRSKFNHQNNQIIVTEVNNILFRTKNHYSFIFDYASDCQDFMACMKNK